MNQIRSAIAVFSALPGTTRGIAWMIFATIFYAATYGVVRLLSTEFSVFQLVFFRSIIGVFLMLPWLFRGGIGQLRTPQPFAYAWRSSLNYGGMVFLIVGLSTMPLQDVTGLMFTTPLFTVLFVALFLREPVGPRRTMALLIGFVGAMIIIRPGFHELSWAALGVLGTSAAYAVVNVSTKTLALAVGEASVVMPFNFLKLPFTVCIGFVWFAENPDLWTGMGAAVIFTSTYYIARRETALKGGTQVKPPPPV